MVPQAHNSILGVTIRLKIDSRFFIKFRFNICLHKKKMLCTSMEIIKKKVCPFFKDVENGRKCSVPGCTGKADTFIVFSLSSQGTKHLTGMADIYLRSLRSLTQLFICSNHFTKVLKMLAGFEPRLLWYCPSFQRMHTNPLSKQGGPACFWFSDT